MNIRVEITNEDLKSLIKEHLSELFNTPIDESKLKIQVKSKQNYKSEWENADFRAIYNR